MTFPQATLTGNFVVDIVVIVVAIGGWYLFQIWSMTQDREMKRRAGRRKGKRGRKYGGGGIWGSMYRGETPMPAGMTLRPVQVLDEPKPQTSSLDSILNPSRKYRLPEAE